jgi:hypothetical protein
MDNGRDYENIAIQTCKINKSLVFF